MPIEKFLYLEKLEYADNWINGGEIPSPNLASSYLSDQRSGINTPDETHIIRGDDPRNLTNYGMKFSENNELPLGHIHVAYSKFNNKPIPNTAYMHEIDDGIILSFANIYDQNIGKMLGEKAVCVKILDMEKLRNCLDKQLDTISKMQECHYVSDHIRDHFTKSNADSWQKEYRIFWPTLKQKALIIPKGSAQFVSEIDRTPIPRLIECPCLSGKRYKQCHGKKPRITETM